MDAPRDPRPGAGKAGSIAALALALTPALASAAPADLFYERTVMAVADARCRLFSKEVSSALAAGQAQAKNAALRAGVDAAELMQVQARATAKARAEPCASAAIVTAAARVNDAFAGFAKLTKMSYPGDHQGWLAERLASRSGRVWNLSQTTSFGRDAMTFGLAGQEGRYELIAVALFADGAQPYSARLVMRDPSKAAKPYLDFRRATTGRPLPLGGRITPRSATRTYLAEARLTPDPLLVPPKTRGAIGYRFPVAAARAMSELDPREAVEVEFLFASRSGQDVVRRGYVEIGDFAAGQAFLAAAAR